MGIERKMVVLVRGLWEVGRVALPLGRLVFYSMVQHVTCDKR